METDSELDEKYKSFSEGFRWRGEEPPNFDQYLCYLNYRHLLDNGLYPAFDWDEIQQVMLREQCIEKTFFPNGRWEIPEGVCVNV
ncbi:MAG TPA: hypothetical protein VMW44_00795 [Candidatus Bathyarchaeia archaeon]|nr:hypothetical protein [Candidatus Bathyarchaeia archaeon]